MTIWLFMIIFHTIAAVFCFIIGVIIISPHRAKNHPWLIQVFMGTLLIMVLFMIAATISHWYNISVSERIAYSALAALGVYMLYRSFEAKKHFSNNQVKEKFIDDVGFVLISLFDGFIIVSLIDLSVPIWMIITGAVLAVIIGNYCIKKTKYNFLKNDK